MYVGIRPYRGFRRMILGDCCVAALPMPVRGSVSRSTYGP